MPFVKRKRNRKLLALLVSAALVAAPVAYATGIPNFDAGNNAENLTQIMRLFKRYGDIVQDYTTKINLDKVLHNARMEMEANLSGYESQEKLKHEENLHNSKIDEMSQPVEEICEIIASKPDQDVTNDRLQKVSSLQDKHQALSIGSHMIDANNAGVTSENGNLTENNTASSKSTFAEQKFAMDKEIVENFREQKSCLIEKFESKEEWLTACQDQVDNPSSIEADYLMNDHAYFSYDEETSKAMKDMIRVIAPPYITDDADAKSVSQEAVVEDIGKQTMSAIASSMLHDVAARRMPGEDTESEMALMDALDGFYYGNMTTPYEQTLASKFSNSVLSTPTLLMREMAEMQALNIHLSLMEYKANLNKEIALSNRIITKYKG
ncbi:hypothetical protein [Vibrio owensii]|uniref:hypothetical protein n=1 Tax=Vibrio harveyi group TaxID=717610 RepID=UPI003CC5F619